MPVQITPIKAVLRGKWWQFHEQTPSEQIYLKITLIENYANWPDYWTIYSIIRQVEKQHRHEHTPILARVLSAGLEQLTDPAGSRHSGGGFATPAVAHKFGNGA
jgi:hypothetical protein